MYTMNDIQKADEHVKAVQCLRVIEYRINNHATVTEACENCGMPTATFYQWLREGVLENYLTDSQTEASKTTQVIIAQGWPQVLRHQLNIASGKITQRGANPTSAAKFLAEIAGLMSERDTKPTEITATFLVQQLQLDREDEDVQIVDGECKELE